MNTSNIYVLKLALWSILIASALLELLFFPSMENVFGCMVTFASAWMFFTWVFKIEIIRSRPVCFVAFLQLFCFMYLPLPMTLLDGKEMSHDLFIPLQTYILQLLYFSLCILAFYLSGLKVEENKIGYLLEKVGYYVSPTNAQLWILGLIGFAFRLYMMSNQGSGEDLAGAGTLGMFEIFIYAPICLLFNPLMGKEKCSRKTTYIVYAYIALLVVLFIATNSRSKMLSPLVVFAFCYLLQQIYIYRDTLWLSYKKIVISILAIFVVSGPLSDLAIAMVAVRGERATSSFEELLSKSIDAYQDKDRLAAYRKMVKEQGESSVGSEWEENYVSNVFLDRFCNYRVADATIYHAQKVGYANDKMLSLFVTQVQAMFPGPIMKFLFPNLDKKSLNFSSMDKLYNLSAHGTLGGYKVGGDVGLGLATFGYFYFPICFLVYILIFYIFDAVVCVFDGIPLFPVFTLLSIYFTYFLKFQVGGGLIAQVTFLLWGFWWVTLWHCITYKLVRLFTFGSNE